MVVWTKSVLDNLLQLAQTVYYGREYEEKNERQRKTKEQAEAFTTEAFTTAMKTVLKQPEKNAQRDPGEKGWACYYCGKEGHLKQDCPQASKPPPYPHVWFAKDHTGRETAPRGIGFQVGLSRQSGLKVPGGPHTSSSPNYT